MAVHTNSEHFRGRGIAHLFITCHQNNIVNSGSHSKAGISKGIAPCWATVLNPCTWDPGQTDISHQGNPPLCTLTMEVRTGDSYPGGLDIFWIESLINTLNTIEVRLLDHYLPSLLEK